MLFWRLDRGCLDMGWALMAATSVIVGWLETPNRSGMGLHASVKPAVPLVRAGMQDRLVVGVAIDEVDGVIGL